MSSPAAAETSRQPGREPQIGVVIVTHGEVDAYADVVSDLLEGGVPPQGILIVHNLVAPGDRQIHPAHPDVRVVRLAGNRGFVAGMNEGIRMQLERGTDWLWLMTHDVGLGADGVAAMRAAALAAGSYGALGPVLALRGTGEPFSMGGRRDRFGRLDHARSGFASVPGPNGIAPAVWLDGTTILARAEALRAVGGYDPSLYAYLDDAFLCLGIERAGWAIGVVADAVATQETGHAARPGAVAFLIARNSLRYRREVAGTPGVLDGVGHELRESVHNARLAVWPRPPELGRRFYWARLVGTWAGVLAFLSGRGGPPPPWLPGLGDMGTGAGRRRRGTPEG